MWHSTPSVGFENHDGSKGVQVAYGWDQAPADGSAFLIRAGVATWVSDLGHGRDSPLVCGESHLESHLFSSRLASRGESLSERALCHGHDDEVTSGWEHAANLCGVLGARLCTLAELEAGETASAACAHDDWQSWAADRPGAVCGRGRHWATSRTGAEQNVTIPAMCMPDSANLAVRCCADVVTGRVCPLPPYQWGAAAPAPEEELHVTPEIIVTQASVDGAHTTVRLALQLGARARSVYALFGTDGSPLHMPPAYQVAPPFGAHVGGTNPALWPVAADARVGSPEHDSWLTVGVTDGDSGSVLGQIGIDWDTWDDRTPLGDERHTGGAVFWMDPRNGPTSRSVVVAQLTVRTSVLGGPEGVATMGVQGKSEPESVDDWQQEGLIFRL